MLTWIIQSSIISIIFIFLVHHLIMFFKTTLTVPKIKDLVNSPNRKYQNIYDTISKSSSYTNIELLPTDIELLPIGDIVNDTSNMKNELKSFLKKQLNTDNDIVMGMDTLSGDKFANF